MLRYRIERLDISKYQYRISIYLIEHIFKFLPSIPWHPRAFYADVLNESLDVSNIEIVRIVFFVHRYRIELDSDIDI